MWSILLEFQRIAHCTNKCKANGTSSKVNVPISSVCKREGDMGEEWGGGGGGGGGG